MTVKQKFDRIDQSKLLKAQVDILKSMQAKTDNFKTKDKEALEKIEMGLDKIIAKLQESNPDALKSTARKTATAKTATKGTKKGKTAMQLAKEIRKPNESWNEAVKRAGSMMRGDAKQASKVVTSELQKLKAFVNRRKQLKGIAGTDLLRDSKRQAKPRGQRTSKDGNVYYEYRENRIDRLAPNYPKNAPLLANGGYMTDPTFGNFQNGVYEEGGGVEDTYSFINKDGIRVRSVAKPDHELSEAEWMAKHNDSIEARDYTNNPKRSYEIGGNLVAYDLAGHLDGTLNVGQNKGLLDGNSGVNYSGLVGETGAMSSGEMFARGGSTDHKYLNHSQDYELRYAKGRNRHGYGNLKFANGGAMMANQQVIDDASQHYVNYYLNEGATAGMFARGGMMPKVSTRKHRND